VTALLSRVIAPRERGLYMGMQQTYGGVRAHHRAALLRLAFDSLGVFGAVLLFVSIPAGDDFA